MNVLGREEISLLKESFLVPWIFLVMYLLLLFFPYIVLVVKNGLKRRSFNSDEEYMLKQLRGINGARENFENTD